jgi:DNA-binding beta-propeller fold protein YncE
VSRLRRLLTRTHNGRAAAILRERDMRPANWTIGVFLLGLVLAAQQAAAADLNNITGTNGLVMIDKRGSLVRFFDPDTFEEVATLDLGAPPHELAISPDRRTAYIPLYGDGVYGNNPNPDHRIVIVDLQTRSVTGTIDVAPNLAPHGLQVDGNGLLYASCDLSRTLLVIDPRAKTIVTTIDIEGAGHWTAVLADGSKAYVANKDDVPFVSVVDLATRKLVGRVPMPNGTQGIAASPDGKRVLAMDFTEPKFYVIDTASDEIVDTIEVARNSIGPFRARFSPDGNSLITVNHVDSLANVYDAKNLEKAQQVHEVGAQAFGIAYAPDNRTALISNHGDGTISVLDLVEGKIVRTFTAGTGIETLSFY